MTSKSLIQILIWGIVLMIFYQGCSPSSYSTRYDPSKKKKASNDEPAGRFSSKNDRENFEAAKKNQSDDNLVADNSTESRVDEIPIVETVDVSEYVKKYEKLKGFGTVLTEREKVLFEIIKYLDTPYQYGGNSISGIDCSAFTQNVYSSSINHYLPRTASEQFQVGENISNKSELKFGDLVFFNTTKRAYPGHVGIYLGDNLFAHASSSQGVMVSSLEGNYFSNRYVGAKRVEDIPGN